MLIGTGKNITLNAVAYVLDPNENAYSIYLNKFNDYSKKNNLNIEINLNLLSSDNSTISTEDYGSMIEATMKKTKDIKYHIYFYDNLYSSKYGPHLLNLEKYLTQDHINMYDSRILDNTCYYKNILVGLVCLLLIS